MTLLYKGGIQVSSPLAKQDAVQRKFSSFYPTVLQSDH